MEHAFSTSFFQIEQKVFGCFLGKTFIAHPKVLYIDMYMYTTSNFQFGHPIYHDCILNATANYYNLTTMLKTAHMKAQTISTISALSNELKADANILTLMLFGICLYDEHSYLSLSLSNCLALSDSLSHNRKHFGIVQPKSTRISKQWNASASSLQIRIRENHPSNTYIWNILCFYCNFDILE